MGYHDQGKVWQVTNKLDIDPFSNKVKIWWNKTLKESVNILEEIVFENVLPDV